MMTFITKSVCAFGAAVAVAVAAWGTLCGQQVRAAEITAVPGPDDQGGMLMPMVSITGFDDLNNPTSGTLSVGFSPSSTPVLRPLESWSPGDWFATTANWRPDIGSPAGVGGTPVANGGNGDLFNNQYGFTFTNMGGTRPNVPANKSLGIKLTSISSPSMESYNYSSSANRWDQVFANVNDQVLWNGSMWHNYFTLPVSAAPGTYTAEFEFFIADTPFTGSTGYAQYDATALAATPDASFTPASVTYTWEVAPVPEPSTMVMLATLAAGSGLATCRRLRRRQQEG